MAQLSLPGAVAPVLTVVDGIPTTTSIEVARHFGKPHKDVLHRIRALLEQLDQEHQRNFSPTFTDVPGPNGATRQDPAYRLTRDGFTLLAMGFTGQRALKFKLAYIDAFNRLERDLLAHSPERIRLAYALAAQVADQAARTVFDAVLAGDDGWQHERWLFTLNPDRATGQPTTPWAKAIDRSAVVMSLADLPRRLLEPGALMATSKELAAIAAACTRLLDKRLGSAPGAATAPNLKACP